MKGSKSKEHSGESKDIYMYFFETVLLDVHESASVVIQKISWHSKVISQKAN